MNWKTVKEKPLCYQTGDWYGKRSDEFVAEILPDKQKAIAVCYESFMDGQHSFDWYIVAQNNEWVLNEKDVIRWAPIETTGMEISTGFDAIFDIIDKSIAVKYGNKVIEGKVEEDEVLFVHHNDDIESPLCLKIECIYENKLTLIFTPMITGFGANKEETQKYIYKEVCPPCITEVYTKQDYKKCVDELKGNV